MLRYVSRGEVHKDFHGLTCGVRMVVRDCPALRHLVKLEQEPDEALCRATRIFNEVLALFRMFMDKPPAADVDENVRNLCRRVDVRFSRVDRESV